MRDTVEQPGRLSIHRTAAAGLRVLVLSGEIDAANVDALARALRVDGGGPVKSVVDFGAVTFIDSSAISVLATAHRDARAAGGWVRLAALSTPVRRVVELVGLDTVIDCYPTLAAASV
ncbi:STAS domain-containing protein [Streptomyces sp. NPDC007084]|uniref:STAS domain-containing protein n=1 Tax=Streptomyces sp. NPDC007084 TaxID=3154313 RepID=UPI00345650A1